MPLCWKANTGDKAREIELPDKSTVTLKPGSELRYSKNFDGSKREVYLSGEAFFNVQKDAARPFLVYSNEVVTKVLGTSFNIKAYADDKEVTVAVKKGKVSVYTTADNLAKSGNAKAVQPEVILTPNYQVVYNRRKDRVYKQVVEVPEIILPQPTLFQMQYDGVPVSRIFEVLEENYGVDIDFDEALLKNCMLTTSMSDEGFYERIEIICKAIGAEYTVTEDAVIAVKSHGCI
jgi:transmembrane sensor